MQGEKIPILPSDGVDRVEHGASVLENHGNVFAADGALLLLRQGVQVLIPEQDLPSRHTAAGGQGHLDSPDDCRFTAARFADNGEDLAGVHVKGDVLYRRGAAAVDDA